MLATRHVATLKQPKHFPDGNAARPWDRVPERGWEGQHLSRKYISRKYLSCNYLSSKYLSSMCLSNKYFSSKCLSC